MLKGSNILSKDKKKVLGQYFTSKEIADLLVSMISRKNDTPKILDPGVGEGVFLEMLAHHGFTDLNAYEIDENLYKIVNNKYPMFNIKLLNFLNSSREDKYDIIIGNPPYVHWNDIEEETLNILNNNEFWKPYINGEWDLLYAFIIWSVEKLRENGEIIFIVPYYWFNSTHAYSLRDYLSQNGYFKVIIHMGEYKLFPDCAPNNIIFKYVKNNNQKNNKKKIKVIEFIKRKGKLNEILERIWEFLKKEVGEDYIHDDENFRFFFQDNFSDNLFWSLINYEEHLLISSIEKSCMNNVPSIKLENFKRNQIIDSTMSNISIPVNHLLDSKDIKKLNQNIKSFIKINGKYYSKNKGTNYLKLKQVLNVGVGMVTGFEEAFFINDDFIKNLSQEEKALIVPFVKGKTCRRFWLDEPTRYIFADEIPNEEVLRAEYPKIHEHLIKYRKKLNTRYKSKNIQFFQWATVRNLPLFKDNLNNEKIFVPCLDRHKKSRFSYTMESYYGSGDALIITKKKYPNIKENLKYICAWLNSEKINEWFKLKGPKRGHRTSYTQTRVEEIPIRLIDWENPEEVKIYNNIIENFDKILKEKGNEEIDEELNKLINQLISK